MIDQVSVIEAVSGHEPRAWQLNLLSACDDRLLLRLPRGAGKSRVAVALALREATASPGRLVLLVSPSRRQSNDLFRKVAAACKSLGLTSSAIEVDGARSTATLENGSRIVSVPAEDSMIQGYSPQLIVVDEATRIPADVRNSLVSILATYGGRLIELESDEPSFV